MSGKRKLVLASASPRRKSLLARQGFDAEVHEPDLDDAMLDSSRHDPESWVLAMAFLKARRVAEQRRAANEIVIGADTVCVDEGSILGKPRDVREAHAMLVRLRKKSHRTLTGVCLIRADTMERTLILDEALVEVGHLADDAIDAYVASGEWQGKAGGYNYEDRERAGWPVACKGDPASVMGLPMARLTPILRDVLDGGPMRAHAMEKSS